MPVHKFQEETRALLQTNMERGAATQRQLGALIHEVSTLPEGAQVLRKAAASADQSNATDTNTAETAGIGSEGAAAALEPPSYVAPDGGAPPTPEHSDGLDDHGKPAEPPSTGSQHEKKSLSRHRRNPVSYMA